MKKFTIYKHTNKINKKVYIGITCQLPKYRWGSNGQGYNNSPHFYSAIQKYGWDNFEHEILYSDLTESEAKQLEINLIEQYQARNPQFGYNSQTGGDVHIPNERTRKQQSISAMNRPIVSEETKQKLSAINKGRSKSKETKQKMSESAKVREQNRTSFKKRVRCLNTGEVFQSLHAAADWCGLVGTSGIALVCKGRKQKTAGVHPVTKEKLKWEYIDE